jgi:hypothetical protein
MGKPAAEKKGKRITYDTWTAKFKPLENANGEIMPFETYGGELEVVKFFLKHAPHRIWTEVDGDKGKTGIVEGFHFVNRLRYFITEVPYDPSYFYWVIYED